MMHPAFAEVPITIVRQRGVPIECWAEGADGNAVRLPITGFDLSGDASTPGEVSIRLHGTRVRMEER